MTEDGGGWTLVIRGTHRASYQKNTHVTTAANNLGEAKTLTGNSFKFQDSDINAVKTMAYRVTTAGGWTNKLFFKPTCTYSSVTTATGDCINSYSSPTWEGLRPGSVGAGMSGLTNGSPADTIYVVTADSRANSFSWFVGNGVTPGVYGTDYGYGTPSDIYVWVK
jgi:hypothetical protein